MYNKISKHSQWAKSSDCGEVRYSFASISILSLTASSEALYAWPLQSGALLICPATMPKESISAWGLKQEFPHIVAAVDVQNAVIRKLSQPVQPLAPPLAQMAPLPQFASSSSLPPPPLPSLPLPPLTSAASSPFAYSALLGSVAQPQSSVSALPPLMSSSLPPLPQSSYLGSHSAPPQSSSSVSSNMFGSFAQQSSSAGAAPSGYSSLAFSSSISSGSSPAPAPVLDVFASQFGK